jgi:hypothetical protein
MHKFPASFRALARDLDRISATLASGEESAVAALVLDVGLEGAHVLVPHEDAPTCVIGDSVALEFTVKGFDEVLDTRAVVGHVHDEEEGRRYGLAFEDVEAFRTRLDPPLMRIFNRRRMMRVRPRPDEPVAIDVAWGDRTMGGTLVNISETGLAVRFPHEAHGLDEGVEEARLTISLPGSADPVAVPSSLRYAHEDDAGEVRWGFEFDWSESEPVDPRLEAIRTYVLARRQAAVGDCAA